MGDGIILNPTLSDLKPSGCKVSDWKMCLDLVGKFDYVESHNVDGYLQSLGVGLVLRKVQSVAKPSLEISFDEISKIWAIKLASIFHIYEIHFKVNEPFEDETYDARTCRTTATSERASKTNKGKLVLNQITEDGTDVKVTLQKDGKGDTIKMSHETGTRSCTLIFKPSTRPVKATNS